ncbi:MAG: hypothetical protein QOH57_2479, partial [Mycobacterium sp.]|nr:hypothetical protein [Mycobacterium sp.]
TLKNDGPEQAVVTKVQADLLFSSMLMDCTESGAGPSVITGNYALTFPLAGDYQFGDLKSESMSTEVHYIVKPSSVDRMQVTVGPERQSGNNYPTVLAVRISLVHDGSQKLEVGAVALAADTEHIQAQIDKSRSASCARDNLSKLDELYANSNVHSSDLDRLRQKYTQLAGG